MIVFESDTEIIIGKKKNEQKIRAEWFVNTGRNIEDYCVYESELVHIHGKLGIVAFNKRGESV